MVHESGLDFQPDDVGGAGCAGGGGQKRPGRRAQKGGRNSVVVQPSFTGTYKGFAVNVWNNFDLSEQNPVSLKRPNSKDAHWNETDLTFSYTREVFKNLNLTAGTIIYLLDGANSAYNSVEIYGGGGYKLAL